MKEKIEKEFEVLLDQFVGYFKHFEANASTLGALMSSKTGEEDQKRFKNAEFTAVEWEYLTKNNILDSSLKRTCSKLLAIIDLNNSAGLELNQELIKKAFAIKGFAEAFENYTEAEVFFVNSEGELQEKYEGGFDKFVEKTKETTKAHYQSIRENIKEELKQFQ